MYQRLSRELLEAFALHEVVSDNEGRPVGFLFVEVNPEFEKLTGLSRDRLIGRTVLEVFPGIDHGWLRRYGEVASTGVSVKTEIYSVLLNKYLAVSAFRLGENRIASTFIDVSDRRRAVDFLKQSESRSKSLIATLEKSEATLATLVDEKNALIKEVHNRVKNNLQIIVSMMNIERGRLCAEGSADQVLVRMQDRILSMADVHDALFRSKALAAANLSLAMQSMADRLADSYDTASRGISVVVHPGELLLPIDFAIPCCLALNELLGNAFQHAFPSHWQGDRLVELGLDLEAGRVVISLRDSGVGMDLETAEGPEAESSTVGGLRLVRLLVEQLDGDLSITSEKGTSVRLTFPIP